MAKKVMEHSSCVCVGVFVFVSNLNEAVVEENAKSPGGGDWCFKQLLWGHIVDNFLHIWASLFVEIMFKSCIARNKN